MRSGPRSVLVPSLLAASRAVSINTILLGQRTGGGVVGRAQQLVRVEEVGVKEKREREWETVSEPKLGFQTAFAFVSSLSPFITLHFVLFIYFLFSLSLSSFFPHFFPFLFFSLTCSAWMLFAFVLRSDEATAKSGLVCYSLLLVTNIIE